jgi:predicted phage-related endonuclease
MAKFWAAVATNQPLDPETTEQTKIIYAQDRGTSIVAPQPIEKAADALKYVKEQIKALEEKEEQLLTALQSHMQWSSELTTFDGRVLATWKNTKGSKRFDAKLFQQQMPDLYEKFMVETQGVRRFLLK